MNEIKIWHIVKFCVLYSNKNGPELCLSIQKLLFDTNEIDITIELIETYLEDYYNSLDTLSTSCHIK